MDTWTFWIGGAGFKEQVEEPAVGDKLIVATMSVKVTKVDRKKKVCEAVLI